MGTADEFKTSQLLQDLILVQQVHTNKQHLFKIGNWLQIILIQSYLFSYVGEFWDSNGLSAPQFCRLHLVLKG